MGLVDKIEIELTVQIGEAEMPLKHVLNTGRGAVISLGGDERQSLNILANGRKIAEGKVVLMGDQVRVRVGKSDASAA